MGTNLLGRMVLEHCQATGDTLAALAERGGMSRQSLSGIVNKPHLDVVPRQATLRALARGLGLSYESVRRLAVASAYGDVEAPKQRPLVLSLTAHAEALDDSQLEVLLATARALKHCPSE